MLLEHSLSFGKYMKKRLSILILILVSFPAGANAIETIRISSTGDGGIKNVTSASAFGEDGNDARAEVHVRNTVDGQGSVEVRVETNVNGVIEERQIREEIQRGGTVKVNTTASIEDVTTEVEIENTKSGTSSAYNIFDQWRSLFAEKRKDEKAGGIETEVKIEASATSSPKGTNIFVSVYQRVIRLLASIW